MLITPNQSMPDIALTGTGTIESIFQLALANGCSITDTPVPGDDYLVPQDAQLDKATLQYLAQNSITIGTKGTPLSQGIGYWKIEVDFTIN